MDAASLIPVHDPVVLALRCHSTVDEFLKAIYMRVNQVAAEGIEIKTSVICILKELCHAIFSIFGKACYLSLLLL